MQWRHDHSNSQLTATFTLVLPVAVTHKMCILSNHLRHKAHTELNKNPYRNYLVIKSAQMDITAQACLVGLG